MNGVRFTSSFSLFRGQTTGNNFFIPLYKLYDAIHNACFS